MLAAGGDNQNGMTKEQRLEELREKLNSKSKVKVSLDVSKVIIPYFMLLSQNIGSDYATSVLPDQPTGPTSINGASTSFKKIKKGNLLKKRQADEDILTLLENTKKDEDGGVNNGLGTREQKQR